MPEPRSSADPCGRAAPTALESARALVSVHADAAEAELIRVCGAGDARLSEAARQAVLAGGKRLRLLLALLSAEAVGGPNDTTVDLAVAVEVMHLASLMHDDVVDGASRRRGAPSVPARWGNRTAVLVGDYLAARAYSELCRIRDWQYLDILSTAAMRMCEAEATFSQIDGQNLEPQDCIEVARGKTAALFAASCQTGSLSAGADPSSAAQFATFGENLGIAFQITDDLLDLYGREETTGKDRGRDIITGQLTLPVVAAVLADDDGEVESAISALRNATEPGPALDRLCEAVEKAGGREAAASEARHRVELALAALEDARPLSREAARAMIGIAQTVLTRSA